MIFFVLGIMYMIVTTIIASILLFLTGFVLLCFTSFLISLIYEPLGEFIDDNIIDKTINQFSRLLAIFIIISLSFSFYSGYSLASFLISWFKNVLHF